MALNKWWLTINTLLILGVCTYLFLNKGSSQRLAYVELDKIYLDFDMKKELEAKIKLVQETRKTILDSMKLSLRILSRQIESENGKNQERLALFSVKREEFYEKEKQFNEDNMNTAKMYDEQIFAQINQYTKDYGSKQDYTIVLGAEGSGVLMYAKEALNITTELKKYINDRYKGKAK